VSIEIGRYLLKIASGSFDGHLKVERLIERESIIVIKETKSGSKEVDILHDIRDISVLNKNTETAEFSMELSAGSVSNLKPEYIIEGLKKYYDVKVYDIEVHRVELGF
jgi:hypothetical protein